MMITSLDCVMSGRLDHLAAHALPSPLPSCTDLTGYSAVQIFSDASAYERWVADTLASPLLEDLKQLGPMIDEVLYMH